MTNHRLHPLLQALLVALACLYGTTAVFAHDGHSHAPSPETRKKIERLNTQSSAIRLVVQRRPTTEPDRPAMASFFDAFKDKVTVKFDNDFLFVHSRGMPDHPMMTGITAWQQQVPLPQDYTGNNAWRIPLNPVPARNPLSAKENFFRGAIALAVNGVPIFNPIKNDGRTDTLKAGELDQWGGHCGRADDYHYHIAPVHLEKIVGKGNPVGVALDGYPIYGYNDPDGSTPKLDWLGGHKDAEGNYHYHASKTYPYLNGGFYGEVVQRGGQVDPQPRAQGVRPAMPPLRGAKITGFENPKPGSYIVRYDVFGEKRSVQYTVAENGSATFNYVSTQGTKTENYTPRQRGGGGGGGGRPAQPPPRRDGEPDDRRPPPGGGDPLIQALDSNRDGRIDRAEMEKAASVLRALDRNRDGSVSAEELRPQGGPPRGPRPDGNRPGGQAGGSGPARDRPQPDDGPRQPWILVHADEVDLNDDKIVTREEIVGEATRAFAGYDTNKDGKLTQDEYSGRAGESRSAMGGFIRGHAKELDRDSDGILTKAEVVGNAERMFGKMDTNEDGKITREEMEASRRR